MERPGDDLSRIRRKASVRFSLRSERAEGSGEEAFEHARVATIRKDLRLQRRLGDPKLRDERSLQCGAHVERRAQVAAFVQYILDENAKITEAALFIQPHADDLRASEDALAAALGG